MPKELQRQLGPVLVPPSLRSGEWLEANAVNEGDARELLPRIEPNSVAVSVWSPPYFVGKSTESSFTFEDWQGLLRDVIAAHWSIIKPGGFLAINITAVSAFRDPSMPKISAETVSAKRSPITREMVLEAMRRHPEMNRYQLSKHLGCSEQTIDRRLNGNNIRGGKYSTQTRLKIVGGLIEGWAERAGFYPYDRRVWVKDPAGKTAAGRACPIVPSTSSNTFSSLEARRHPR